MSEPDPLVAKAVQDIVTGVCDTLSAALGWVPIRSDQTAAKVAAYADELDEALRCNKLDREFYSVVTRLRDIVREAGQ